MSKSRLGYSKGSPYRENPYIDIQSPQGLIDMSNTDMDLYAIDNTGLEKYLPAYSGMHQFAGDVIREIPMKKGGPSPSKAREILKDGKAHGKKLTKKQKRYFGWIYGKSKAQEGGNPYLKSAIDFLFNDEDDEYFAEQEEAQIKQEELEARELDLQQREADLQVAQDDNMALLADEALINSLLYPQDEVEAEQAASQTYVPFGPDNPYAGQILSTGKHGASNIGEYGKQIYGMLSNDLGYTPVANSIYRDAKQNEIVGGVKNSFHLTGDAIDLKPADWNKLSKDKQSYYRQNFDVDYHNNHYHIEPKGKPGKVTSPINQGATSAISKATATGTRNSKTNQALNFFIGKGLPEHVAAGIVGNLMQESGNFRDDVIKGELLGDQGTAFGIAQWRGDRRKNMINWAKKNNMNPYTLEAQLEFVYKEARERGDLEYTSQSKNSGEAAYRFAEKYERPKHIDQRRIGYARQLSPYKKGGKYIIDYDKIVEMKKQGYKFKLSTWE